MSSAPGLRRRSIAEVVVEELEKREINPIDERSEPFSSQNATSVPVEAGQLEAVLRHLVSSGMVPFTLGFAMHKARVFEPKVIQGEFWTEEGVQHWFRASEMGLILIYSILPSNQISS